MWPQLDHTALMWPRLEHTALMWPRLEHSSFLRLCFLSDESDQDEESDDGTQTKPLMGKAGKIPLLYLL